MHTGIFSRVWCFSNELNCKMQNNLQIYKYSLEQLKLKVDLNLNLNLGCSNNLNSSNKFKNGKSFA